MKHSTDRILTTHVGSLCRPADVLAIINKHQEGTDFSSQERATIDGEVASAVRMQSECGIDVPSDGEFSKSSFSAYVQDRLTGFETKPPADGARLFDRGRDRKRFREAYEEIDGGASTSVGVVVCSGPISYRGRNKVEADLAAFKAALEGLNFAEAFVPAVAPGTVELQRRNEYYQTEEEYLYAIADAMRTEYRMIVDAGFILQIDDPRLVTEFDSIDPAPAPEVYANFVAVRVEALNHALEGLPQDRIRYHVCWGSWHGPHSTDIPLKDIAPIVLNIHAGAFSIEAANPRHEHEYHVWETVKLTDGTILIPGVIAHTTNHVEHPELVAERIVNYAAIVGRENVIAGVDCGFAQGAGTQRVHPTIMWEKFRMLSEGARIASRRLWPY
jgi:5-methyltetrahydropteroyltriglutamate--homocysteine methyltransferase